MGSTFTYSIALTVHDTHLTSLGVVGMYVPIDEAFSHTQLQYQAKARLRSLKEGSITVTVDYSNGSVQLSANSRTIAVPDKSATLYFNDWQPVVGPNTLVITYTSAGGQTTEYTITVDAQDDSLESLSFTGLRVDSTMTPAFNPAVTNYAIQSLDSDTVTMTAACVAGSTGTFTVDWDTPVALGAQNSLSQLSVGAHEIRVTCTSAMGSNTVYTIALTVYGTRLTGVVIEGAFSPLQPDFADTYSSFDAKARMQDCVTGKLKFRYNAEFDAGYVELYAPENTLLPFINGSAIISSSMWQPGLNQLAFAYTNVGGQTQQYALFIEVYDDRLESLGWSGLKAGTTMQPAFAADTTSYTIESEYGSQVAVIPACAAWARPVSVSADGTTVAGDLPMFALGAHTVSVTCTSAMGSTFTYSIALTVHDVPLRDLAISGLVGSYSFKADVIEYTVISSINLASAGAISLTPTFDIGANLSVTVNNGAVTYLVSGHTWTPSVEFVVGEHTFVLAYMSPFDNTIVYTITLTVQDLSIRALTVLGAQSDWEFNATVLEYASTATIQSSANGQIGLTAVFDEGSHAVLQFEGADIDLESNQSWMPANLTVW